MVIQKNNKSILFLCTGNSCRSQIAEGIAKKILVDSCKIESAGTEAHGVNPNAIVTLDEIGIDISKNKSKKVKTMDLANFNLIITLCGDARDKCPVFGSDIEHIHWDIKDPASFKGSMKEVKNKYSQTRDIILEKIKDLKITIEKEN